jgi:hypothetical protein
MSGSLEAQTPDMFLHRFPDEMAEDAMEVEGREPCHRRQFVKRQWVVQVVLDVNQRRQKTALVVIESPLLHGVRAWWTILDETSARLTVFADSSCLPKAARARCGCQSAYVFHPDRLALAADTEPCGLGAPAPRRPSERS